ncbi:MAG TPA: TRAP transporter small permease subunit [Aurantimonas sp.]
MIGFADGADRLVRVVGEAAAWTGLVMVLLIGFNVFARYLFSYGSVALQEAEWHLLAVGALFGMSYGLNQGEEVRVDVLYGGYSPRTKRVVDTIASLLLFLTSVAVATLSIGFVLQSYSLGEGSADPGGLPLRWVLKASIPAAFLLLALQALSNLIVLGAGLLNPDFANSRRPTSES